MRDKPVPIEPEYTPAGPDAESTAVPDNPPPTSEQPFHEQSVDADGGDGPPLAGDGG